MEQVRSELADGIGIVTLDHPARRNALSAELVAAVVAALDRLEVDKARVAILRAARGVKVWSAGHDVGELPESRRDPLGWDDPLRHLVRRIELFPAPVIAMIEGTVWGGATETVFACDLIVATPEASFAVTPAKLGVPYNVSGMLTFLNAGSIRAVKELAFTARPMSAARAEQLGIINYVVPADEIETFTRELARGITALAPLSIAVMKEQPDFTAGLRAHPGLAPRGLRQPRLPRRHPRLQGKAGTGVPRRIGRAPGGAGPAAARRGRGTRTVGSGRTQRTRSPGAAPSSGCSRNMPGEPFSSAWLAASTMPSLRPNFILRGARLATITVSLPASCSGL
jgi:methylmalonyl-CoA decarboxylase